MKLAVADDERLCLRPEENYGESSRKELRSLDWVIDVFMQSADLSWSDALADERLAVWKVFHGALRPHAVTSWRRTKRYSLVSEWILSQPLVTDTVEGVVAGETPGRWKVCGDEGAFLRGLYCWAAGFLVQTRHENHFMDEGLAGVPWSVHAFRHFLFSLYPHLKRSDNPAAAQIEKAAAEGGLG